MDGYKDGERQKQKHRSPAPAPHSHTCCQVSKSLTEVIVVGVEVRQLLCHVLFGDEVQHLSHIPILYDGHTLDGALAFDAGTVHCMAAAGATQLAQAIEGGHGRHGARVPLTLPTEQDETLQILLSPGTAFSSPLVRENFKRLLQRSSIKK